MTHPHSHPSVDLAARYRAVWVDRIDDTEAVRAAAESCRLAVASVLTFMIERFERDPDYGFLDMKIDVLSGADFPKDDPLRGRGTIYGWIQGRGLEALAGHAAAMERLEALSADQRAALLARTRAAAHRALDHLERIRAGNAGRLSFMMTVEGRPLMVDAHGAVRPPRHDDHRPSHYTDLFYAKGLAAVAAMLGDSRRLAIAREMLDRVHRDIVSDRFRSDQETIDPRNNVAPQPGRRSHGPRMIAIGAAALLLDLTRDPVYRDMGLSLIDHILRHHVDPETFDLWEFIDEAGRPFHEGDALRCDPGHATEFAGLSLKFLRICEETRVVDESLAARLPMLRRSLGNVLTRNFQNGFSVDGIGICKAFDLRSRRPMNTDMPWWPLPETMRAAIEAWHCRADADEVCLDIARRCSNAFMRHYIRPDRWLLANQVIDEAGLPVARIPATPDADPGYHTGLCLLDCLRLCDHTRK